MSIDITGIGALANAASSIVDKIWPDKTEVEKAALAAEVQIALAQNTVNAEEAKSTNWFVAGWRPFIGWTCGAGLCYQFLFMPVINGLVFGLFKITPFVALDIGTLMTCLSGLLGLGGLRTYEKKTGIESAR
jgi:hypothetical protein